MVKDSAQTAPKRRFSGPFFYNLFWRVFLTKYFLPAAFLKLLIMLDDGCFVQPQAILKISKERAFNRWEKLPEQPTFDQMWKDVINVTLIGDEKRCIVFDDLASRNERFQQIFETLKLA
jgi:hypothetical protein